MVGRFIFCSETVILNSSSSFDTATGFMSSCLIRPLHMVEQTEDADLDALLKNDQKSRDIKRHIMQNPRVQVNLRKLLPIYDSLGIFD